MKNRNWLQQISSLLSIASLFSLPVFSAPQEKKSAAQKTKSSMSKTKTSTESSSTGTTSSASTANASTVVSRYPNDLVGEWVSEWGPVSFKQSADSSVSGQWIEGKNKIGKIEHGKFNEKTGEVEFDLWELWTNLKGHAKLKLSADRQELSGNWTREKKGSKEKDKGAWSMKRPAN